MLGLNLIYVSKRGQISLLAKYHPGHVNQTYGKGTTSNIVCAEDQKES